MSVDELRPGAGAGAEPGDAGQPGGEDGLGGADMSEPGVEGDEEMPQGLASSQMSESGVKRSGSGEEMDTGGEGVAETGGEGVAEERWGLG
jgi:hypothetical protein